MSNEGEAYSQQELEEAVSYLLQIGVIIETSEGKSVHPLFAAALIIKEP
jgi:hypothetical protein